MKSLIRVVVVASLFFLVGSSKTMAQFPFFENNNIGKPAPDFTLMTLSGKTTNMTEYRSGQNAIIFFWATWCPHCRVALKELNQEGSQIVAKGIKLVIVDLGETEPEVRSHIQRQKINLDVFLDKNSSLAEPYGLIGVPTFFFVDQNGIVKAVKHSLPENLDAVFPAK